MRSHVDVLKAQAGVEDVRPLIHLDIPKKRNGVRDVMACTVLKS